MEVWVLILWIGSGYGSGVAMQEFSSEERCRAAFELVEEEFTTFGRGVDGICVRK